MERVENIVANGENARHDSTMFSMLLNANVSVGNKELRIGKIVVHIDHLKTFQKH